MLSPRTLPRVAPVTAAGPAQASLSSLPCASQPHPRLVYAQACRDTPFPHHTCFALRQQGRRRASLSVADDGIAGAPGTRAARAGSERSTFRRRPTQLAAQAGGPEARLRDTLVSFGIVAPLVATFWRGSWVMLDNLLPEDTIEAGVRPLCVGREVGAGAVTDSRPTVPSSGPEHCAGLPHRGSGARSSTSCAC